MRDKRMLELFFWTAREREMIRLKRESGQAPPWTKDTVLAANRFTNVRREHDRVTVWFRNSLRDPLQDNPARVVLATVVFRTFNLVATGEKLKPMLLRGAWDGSKARTLLAGQAPVVTGAYIVRSPWGMNKLDGVIKIINGFLDTDVLEGMREVSSLQEAHTLLMQVPYFGHFTSYEIVSDLRWTCVLRDAPDIMTWANPGPGCLRGMEYILGIPLPQSRANRELCLANMVWLLECSRKQRYWPQELGQWEMREVEHWLCEFSKYMHAKEGKRLKRRFTP
jgi:hypothetical protein